MSFKSNRRGFLRNLLGASAGIIVPTSSNSKITANAMDNQIKVRKVEALGFQWETRDPFLFCVHHEDFFPEGNKNMGPPEKFLKGRNIGSDFMIKDGFRMYHGDKVPGFPGHPHRGFETITVVRKGIVDHSDSMGATGRYGNGDVQWMTAGKGVQHAEMFPLIYEDKPNPMELFQIWLNLPRKSKMVEPHFKMFWNDTIPVKKFIDSNGKNSTVEIIAGKLEDYESQNPPPDSWAADKNNHVAIWNFHMEAGAEIDLPASVPEVNRSIYFYKGERLLIDGTTIPEYHSAILSPEYEMKIKAGNKECRFLLLQGKPIQEPVVQHGPFVMNNRQEIQQAFNDYQRDQFGGWPYEVSGPVHDKSKGRFAYHADGSKEDKNSLH